LLLVSHDRTFLDNVVTSTLVFEGDGKFSEYAGGYDDWERYQGRIPEAPGQPQKRAIVQSTLAAAAEAKRDNKPRKLTYKEQRELEALPGKIEGLEQEQAELHTRMGNSDIYRQAGGKIPAMMERLETIKHDLEQCYRRWQDLDSIGRG
jgi:ATP-binding cassette subfamily F protein uup